MWCQRWSGTALRLALHVSKPNSDVTDYLVFTFLFLLLHTPGTLIKPSHLIKRHALDIMLFFLHVLFGFNSLRFPVTVSPPKVRDNENGICPFQNRIIFWSALRFSSDQLSVLMFYQLFWAHSSHSFVRMPVRHQAMGTQYSYRASSYLLLLTVWEQSFINKRMLLFCGVRIHKWLYIDRSKSLEATVAVSIISSGATDPKPAWGYSSVLVTETASLVTVQMTGALVKDISPPVESQVSSQIGCWPPGCLWSWRGGEVREGAKDKTRSGASGSRPQGTARTRPLLSGQFWELTCPWPLMYNEASRLGTPSRSGEAADSQEEERERESGKNCGPLWQRMGYPAVECRSVGSWVGAGHG